MYLGGCHCPNRAQQVIVQDVDGTSILLHLETGRYYSLDQIGSRIWQLCDGTRTPSAIGDALSKEYDISTRQAVRDVTALIEQLERAKLVRFA